MISTYRSIGIVTAALTLAGGSAEAQFYGGGYWGGDWGGWFGGAGSTVEGSILQGSGMYAMGMGRYNLDSAQAWSINSDTAKRWNQFMHESSIESNRIYNERVQRRSANERSSFNANRERLRNNPTSVDIANGSALNRAMEELNDPKVFPKAIDYGGKMKLGGESIRNIPFQYASAGISTSVHQLVNGPPPAPLRRDEFGPDIEKLKAIVAELRKEAQEMDAPSPETIRKAKDQILALEARIEAVFPRASQERRDAERYTKSLFGLASMLDTPAVNVLLAGVERRPEATVGDLLGFMAAYNLRFGASTNNNQRQVYTALFPMIAKLRDEVVPPTAAAPSATPAAPAAVASVPAEVFDGLGFHNAENKVPPHPLPAPK